MRKFNLVALASILFFDAVAASLCSGSSMATCLDTGFGVRTISGGEVVGIRYSSSWESSSSTAVAHVIMNDEVLHEGDSGVLEWQPTRNGTYELTHVVKVDGVPVGETLATTMVVSGIVPQDPVIIPASGTIIDGSLTISMTCQSEGATIRYTVDGSEPTESSSAYRRFRVSQKTTVKAKSFYEDGAGSETVAAEFALGRCPDPVVVSTGGATFRGDNLVSIEWDCADGVLRYTTDGSDVTPESPVYEAPFAISESTIVKAKAFGVDYFDSAMVTANLIREQTIGDILGAPDQNFTTCGAREWIFEGPASMRSGAIADGEESVLSTVVRGYGMFSFEWKTSCESDEEYHEWDHVELRVDGTVVKVLDGVTDWMRVSITVEGPGDHVVDWVYLKDEMEKDGEDCAWIRAFSWDRQETQSTAVPIPFAWIDGYFPGASDYEAVAKGMSANGRETVEECYVAGLNPTDAASELVAKIDLVDNEVRISWMPNLNTGAVTRIYTVYGRTNLEDGDWEPVQPWHRFFKVVVALPTGADGEETAVSGEGFAPQSGGVQLWEGGPYWAECNVGATKPEEYGYYFWWGDTVGYTRSGGTWGSYFSQYSGVTWVSSADTSMGNSPFSSSSCPTYKKSASQLRSAGYIDGMGNLVAKYDAATAHLGAPWRMPTSAEIDALISNCTTTWTTRNGVYGQLVTGKGAFSTKSIFLPAAGRGYDSNLTNLGSYGGYWSSAPHPDYSYRAWQLRFYSDSFDRANFADRDTGQSVRPLRGFVK